MGTETKKETFRLQIVQMADTEWSSHQGGKIMENIARQVLETGTCDICEVWEHGGWSLGYAFIGEQLTCISSANDMAQFPPEVKAFRERVYAGTLEYLPAIRRKEEFEPSETAKNLRYWIEKARENLRAQQVNCPGRCDSYTEYWSVLYEIRLSMLLKEIDLK